MGFLDFYRYEKLAHNEDGDIEHVEPRERRKSWSTAVGLVFLAAFALTWIALKGYICHGAAVLQDSLTSISTNNGESCDSIVDGYHCAEEISHYWGQYSSYFRVPSEISPKIPDTCKVTHASVLSRHGARDPTLSKSLLYASFITALKQNVTHFEGKYAFLNDYEYTLGADMLNAFGKQQMVNSGIKFYNRYKHLSQQAPPFIRASGQQRVIDSAELFGQGFHQAFVEDRKQKDEEYPYSMLVIEESPTSNNTLNNHLCTAREIGWPSHIENAAKGQWVDIFTAPLLERLQNDLPGAYLEKSDVLIFLDLCPFETVASPTGKISDFCHLFSEEEWRQFDYYESLGKWYGFGNGNYFGATNGAGFVNELIARLTSLPVDDHTCTNRTLDSNPKTFPLDSEHRLFADFSHDNDLTTVIAALGLFNNTSQLSNTTFEDMKQTKGYSASWTVPFAGRIYFEVLQCGAESPPKIRVLVNDRVMPLEWCKGSKDGMCDVQSFIEGLSFARASGKWDECFE